MENNNTTIEKIDLLISKFQDPAYPEDLDKIKSLKETMQDLLAREALCQNETLKTIIKKYAIDVETSNKKLLIEDSTLLPDAQRDRLLDKKNLYLNFISTFDLLEIQKSIQGVDKEVDEEIAHLDL